jgi:rubrerythrin
MSPNVPGTLHDLMTQALAMEREAVERYTELADAMEVHNNAEVATLFRKMAAVEGKHCEQIMAEMGWKTPPAMPTTGFGWPDFEAPETVPNEEVHYLMTPWHALNLALAAEQRAEAFYGALAEGATDASVRRAALDMQREEREHVSLVKAWIEKFPEPEGNWAVDPDPPRYNE